MMLSLLTHSLAGPRRRFVRIGLGWIPFVIFLVSVPAQANATCGKHGVWLQVLGSGGPELDDKRASSGYLVWRDGKARVLVDMGAGSMLRFEQAGASINDLDFILLSHLHVDHSNDLPALVKASYFSGRDRDLPLYGPSGNQRMPSIGMFVINLFGTGGAYRYLGDFIDGHADYRLVPHEVDARAPAGNVATKLIGKVVYSDKQYRISVAPVHHGPIPALAWRVETGGHTLVFSGDMNNKYQTLAGLAKDADVLVAHHAIPEEASGVARNLHMPPSVIGQIAAAAKVKQLVLSHRMNRTLGREAASKKEIRRTYRGPLHFAEDLQCFKP